MALAPFWLPSLLGHRDRRLRRPSLSASESLQPETAGRLGKMDAASQADTVDTQSFLNQVASMHIKKLLSLTQTLLWEMRRFFP